MRYQEEHARQGSLACTDDEVFTQEHTVLNRHLPARRLLLSRRRSVCCSWRPCSRRWRRAGRQENGARRSASAASLAPGRTGPAPAPGWHPHPVQAKCCQLSSRCQPGACARMPCWFIYFAIMTGMRHCTAPAMYNPNRCLGSCMPDAHLPHDRNTGRMRRAHHKQAMTTSAVCAYMRHRRGCTHRSRSIAGAQVRAGTCKRHARAIGPQRQGLAQHLDRLCMLPCPGALLCLIPQLQHLAGAGCVTTLHCRYSHVPLPMISLYYCLWELSRSGEDLACGSSYQ